MTSFTFTSPEGKEYTVEGPEGATKEQAWMVLQAKLGGQATQPDKYQQAARDEYNPQQPPRLTSQVAHGATFGADTALTAAAMTPLEMIKRGTLNPIEGYNYAKAREDYGLAKARENNGLLGTGAEILGGAVSGGGLANGGASLASRAANPVWRWLGGGADAAILGGVSGFNEGNGLSERLSNAVHGGEVGGALGLALPPALQVAGKLAKPVIDKLGGNMVRAWLNPQAAADAQLATGIQNSGQNPQQIAGAVQQAAAEGQPQFAVADAMGIRGQRMLAPIARTPGQAQTDVVNFLDGRQATQGRRVVNALEDGFGSRMTPTQLREGMEASRSGVSNENYSNARNGAGQVDVVPTLNNLDRNIGTTPGQNVTPVNDSVEAVLTPFRERLARVNPDDFEAVQRIRGDMADAAARAERAGEGNRARLIGQAVRALDASMEDAGPGFRQANRSHALMSRDIDAIDAGRNAAMRGRTEDTIPAYQALGPRGQQAFRTGYVDPLIEQAQSAAPGVNKARPLLNDAVQDEAAAMAPGNALMQRRLARENTMFETRNHATGGSRTADNLAEAEAQQFDPHLIMQLASGHWGGALKTLSAHGLNYFNGTTPEVKQRIAEVLLQRGPNVSGAQLQAMVDRVTQRLESMQRLYAGMRRGAAYGGAVAAGGDQKQERLRITPLR